MRPEAIAEPTLKSPSASRRAAGGGVRIQNSAFPAKGKKRTTVRTPSVAPVLCKTSHWLSIIPQEASVAKHSVCVKKRNSAGAERGKHFSVWNASPKSIALLPSSRGRDFNIDLVNPRLLAVRCSPRWRISWGVLIEFKRRFFFWKVTRFQIIQAHWRTFHMLRQSNG